MIDPDIWDSAQVQGLTAHQFKLYIWLISQADDEGRLKVKLGNWPIRLWPFNKRYTSEKLALDLVAISDAGLILVYGVDGETFIQHPNWKKYQWLSHPAPSRCPEPPEKVIHIVHNSPVDSGVLRCAPPNELVSIDKGGRAAAQHERRGDGMPRRVAARTSGKKKGMAW